MSTDHPALEASHKSWDCVQNKKKEEWLSLFANDAVVEDPVGPSPLDPEGKGHKGEEAISAFWDANIGPNVVKINFNQSYDVGKEIAHVGTITITGGEESMLGKGNSMKVDMVAIYKVNDDGKLYSLRAFWELEKAMATLTEAS